MMMMMNLGITVDNMGLAVNCAMNDNKVMFYCEIQTMLKSNLTPANTN